MNNYFSLALIHRGVIGLKFKILKHRVGSPLSEENLNKSQIFWANYVEKHYLI